MFAIITISGKQHTVNKGDILDVDAIKGKVGDTVALAEVLLISDTNKKVQVGQPKVKNSRVTARILSQFRGKKIEVRRFKSKVRYRRHTGFRPSKTKVEILTIE